MEELDKTYYLQVKVQIIILTLSDLRQKSPWESQGLLLTMLSYNRRSPGIGHIDQLLRPLNYWKGVKVHEDGWGWWGLLERKLGERTVLVVTGLKVRGLAVYHGHWV